MRDSDNDEYDYQQEDELADEDSASKYQKEKQKEKKQSHVNTSVYYRQEPKEAEGLEPPRAINPSTLSRRISTPLRASVVPMRAVGFEPTQNESRGLQPRPTLQLWRTPKMPVGTVLADRARFTITERLETLIRIRPLMSLAHEPASDSH